MNKSSSSDSDDVESDGDLKKLPTKKSSAASATQLKVQDSQRPTSKGGYVLDDEDEKK